MRKWIGGLVAVALLPATARAAADGHDAFTWLDFLAAKVHLPQYMVSAILIAVLLVALSLLTGWRKNPADMVIPDPRLSLRNVFELILGFLMGLGENILGHHARKYMPLLATCFIFILFMNLLGLIPGFLPPTDQMNVTLGLALIVFLSTHVFGVREHGLAYFKHFLGPVWWMAPIMLPIEIISHLARPMSLSLRLFGNITGDHMVLVIFLGLVPFVIPSIFYGFGAFVSFMQAFIFTVLSMIYIAGAVAHEEEH
jgi:F-type H+-transporting ATPase subunit a